MENILNETQSEILSEFSELFQQMNDNGLVVRANGESNMIIVQKDKIEKILSGEILPHNYVPKEQELILSKQLDKLIKQCHENNILFNCSADGIYAVDENLYNSFVEKYNGDVAISEEELTEFTAQVFQVDDYGTYYQVPQYCSSCDTECDICDCHA
jgi:hypothetical protein